MESPIDFCEVAIFEAGSLKVVSRYTYFEGFLVLLSKADISNAQIHRLDGVVYEQRKKFSNGLGKGRRVCIKVFPKLLTSSPTCIRFVLYHEIAHIRNGDIKVPDYITKRKESLLTGQAVKQELIADMYAAKKIGKANALQALGEIHKRKSRALAHMRKFEKHNYDRIQAHPVLKDQLANEIVNLDLSVKELNLRIQSLETLNIK